MRFLFSLCVWLLLGSSIGGCTPQVEPATKAEVTALRKRVGQLERRIDALEKRPVKTKAPANKSKNGKAGNKAAPAGKAPGKSTGKAPGKSTGKAPAGKSTGKTPAGKSSGKAPGGKAGQGQKAPGKADQSG